MVTDLFRLRRILGATFVFGSAGTGTELMLLEHVEGFWQVLPLVLLALGCVAGLFARKGGTAIRQSFVVLMAVFAISGLLGVALHYQGNVAFELELSPDAEGLDLFWEAMHGATPALAPGTMILLGAVGLAYARLTDRPTT
jgi:hypothetical protein